MKYRIIKKNDMFYPQYRSWFVWRYFLQDRHFEEKTPFTSLDGAKQFINGQKMEKIAKRTPKMYKVVWEDQD